MSPLVISCIVFGIIFGGALAGMVLRVLLPEHHLEQDSRDVVKLGMGLVATMSALVLGLLIASAKSSYDTQRAGLAQMSANVILLDRVLDHYGPETKAIRQQVRQEAEALLQRIWSNAEGTSARIEPTNNSEGVYEAIQRLTPKNDGQRTLQTAAIKTAIDVAQARWLLFTQRSSAIPVPFLVVMVFWLAMIFASFSLFARPNATVVVTLLVCALSVSGAIFLILELDRPFDGVMQISSFPVHRALDQLGR
jgi:hypothetical protein